MRNPFDGLDDIELVPGDRVQVESNYVGSEVSHYNGQRGFIQMQMLDALKRPGLLVKLDALDRPVLLYPYELRHDTDKADQ